MKAILTVFLLSANLVWAQTSERTTAPKQSSSTNSAPRRIVYKAAAGSAPAARVTGGSRGTGDSLVRLDVLSPDDTGLTTQEQPSLFWYQSRPSQAGLELTLLEENKAKPLLHIKPGTSSKSGIQRLKLADHGIKLEKDKEYQWVVALVTDPANRSSDLVASGFIKRVELPAEVKEKLAKAAPEERPAILAEAGIWHDALASLSDLIEAQPNADRLRATRADLLRQVGLTFAADSDKPKAQN